MKLWKRTMAFALALLTCVSGFGHWSLNVSADENEIVEELSDDLVEAPTFCPEDEYEDANAGIMMLGLDEEDDYREWVQSDPRWASLTLGTSSYTVKNSGCLITSIAKLIVQCGLKSADEFTPAELVAWMNANGGFTSGGAMYWSKPAQCVSGFGTYGFLLQDGEYSTEEYNDKIVAWVKAGYHIVVNVKSKSHWVAIDEARTLETGTVYMFDTIAGYVNTNITLAERYPTIYRAYAYTGGKTPTSGDDVGSTIPAMSYTDVTSSDWYYSAIEYVYENGLMNGMSETKFSPETNLTRAQFATILYRIHGTPEVTYKKTFSDVPEGEWYADAVLWANEMGIVLGYPNGKFGTDDNITREQMVTMMYRYANKQGYDTSEKVDFSSFKDAAKVSDYAVDALRWTVAMGIVTGRTDGTVDPQGTATRAECATIIMRFEEIDN